MDEEIFHDILRDISKLQSFVETKFLSYDSSLKSLPPIANEVKNNSKNIEVLINKIDDKLEGLFLDQTKRTEDFKLLRDDVRQVSDRVAKAEMAIQIFEKQELHPRVVKLEQRWWWVMGAIAAAGTFGGILSALITWGLQFLM